MNGSNELINFNGMLEPAILVLVLFLIVFARYFFVSAIFYLVFYRLWPQKFTHRKVSKGSFKKGQFRKEVGFSALTSFIFAVSGMLMVWSWQAGLTAVYTNIGDYGWWWFFASILIALFLHETYYYWIHRWMHRPKVFRKIHKTHHESVISSPWTAFSFHPWESMLQAIVVPAIVFVLPMHPLAILCMLVIMTISAVINHLDIEVYPAGSHRHWLGRWLIGATHHSLHHTEFSTNYGLYFTFWDKWMGTESSKFEATFEQKTSADNPSVGADRGK